MTHRALAASAVYVDVKGSLRWQAIDATVKPWGRAASAWTRQPDDRLLSDDVLARL
jgi:hypothetical protein